MTARTTEQMLREEAVAIHGEARIAEILATIPGNKVFEKIEGKELYRVLNRLNSAALCLSGGGIRSAAFALGAIEALAAHPRTEKGAVVGEAKDCLLTKFHYLSTVSGGGYIGSWLSAWVAREATYRKGNFSQVWEKLVDKRKTPEKEPEEITWLREFSNY